MQMPQFVVMHRIFMEVLDFTLIWITHPNWKQYRFASEETKQKKGSEWWWYVATAVII